MKTTTKLTVGANGTLEEVVSIAASTALPRLEGKPTRGLVYVQKLVNEEIKLPSGIIIPAAANNETRAVIVAVGQDVADYQVGDIITLSFGHGNPPIYIIEGEPLTPIYPNSIVWVYKERITNYKN